MRLLPKDPDIGWTPYVWLIYVVNLPIYLLFERAGALEWVLTLAGLAAFLVLYFRGFWLEGRRLLRVLAAIALLGVVFSPFNPGAVVYFIYAGAFAAHAGPPRLAWRVILLLELALAVEAWLASIPPQGWIPGVVFTVLIGAINIYYRERSRTHAKLKLAQEEVERLAAMAERERIARDLHDLLGHTLSVITLKSELAARLALTQPERAQREMREVERIARQSLAEVRDAVRGYRTAGLEAELTNAHLACEAAGVTLTIERPALDPATAPRSALAPKQENALALALREAVTNVVRHAAAGRCRVRLAREGEQIVLTVEDDGRGGGATEGSGLAGMRERVEELGGTVLRDGSRGTRLEVRLPAAEGPVPAPALPPEALRSAAG